MHSEKYAEQKAWDVLYHVELWAHAKQGWTEESVNADFRYVYSELRNFWQVFRPMKRPPDAEEVWSLLNQIDTALRTVRLSELKPVHGAVVRRALDLGGTLKQTADGPSLMAASKFLHFWNPRLFVIVDRKVMSEYVLQHVWIKRSISDFCKRSFEPDFEHYQDLLGWCSVVLQEFPFILDGFRQYVRKIVRDSSLCRVAWDCEAAALEWFLLGVVELPPS